jgi:hypothetical protein
LASASPPPFDGCSASTRRERFRRLDGWRPPVATCRGATRLSARSGSPAAGHEVDGNPGAAGSRLRRAVVFIRDLALLRSSRNHVRKSPRLRGATTAGRLETAPRLVCRAPFRQMSPPGHKRGTCDVRQYRLAASCRPPRNGALASCRSATSAFESRRLGWDWPKWVRTGRRQIDGFLATDSESGRSIVQGELCSSTRRD